MPLETLVDGYSFFVRTSPTELGPEGGLFHRDTRYLSELSIDVPDAVLVPMGETLEAANVRTVTLATASPAVNEISEQAVAKHTELVVSRRQSVHEGAGYAETITVHNYSATPKTLALRVRFEADFADLFEVRGIGSDIDRTVETTVAERSVEKRYAYDDADGERIRRRSTIQFGLDPVDISPAEAVFSLRVESQDARELPFAVHIGGSAAETTDRTPDEGLTDESDGAANATTHPPRTPPVAVPSVSTGRDAYDAVFERAATDLRALTTETSHGPVPLAGTPWFVTPFGRDAILTAHQTLAAAPSLAVGTLRYFAANRGLASDPTREEEPGKVFHEIRHGELAARERIPHTPYFGTVDATPLWVMLLDEACRWRDDDALAVELSDALVDALAWIRRTSEDGADDPFLYYPDAGLLEHKAWKDTADSVRFADGTVADHPLAVAEVQGYAARALDRGAALLERLDVDADASPAAYRERARRIERAFDEEFWLPERSFYGLAKAGDGRIVDAVTSNVGHCLWTETIPESRAEAVTATLLDESLSSGWGLRTMSQADAGYSPVSYHAGGVWPHDTSLVALGFARYGRADAAETLAASVLDAATHLEHARLPELYCGFDDDRTPVEYPAACTPQAWAAGAPFAFLHATFDFVPGADGPTPRRTPDLFDAAAVESLRDGVAVPSER